MIIGRIDDDGIIREEVRSLPANWQTNSFGNVLFIYKYVKVSHSGIELRGEIVKGGHKYKCDVTCEKHELLQPVGIKMGNKPDFEKIEYADSLETAREMTLILMEFLAYMAVHPKDTQGLEESLRFRLEEVIKNHKQKDPSPPDDADAAVCHKCGAQMATSKSLQCLKCGFKWFKCPHCGASWIRGKTTCRSCGKHLRKLAGHNFKIGNRLLNIVRRICNRTPI